ncbi:MAG: sulfatase-like hydrolase/transferase [Chthoniobacter sp.]|nr:sulfatase-like hydrolase/transferase [Chthoniobacter sp.]
MKRPILPLTLWLLHLVAAPFAMAEKKPDGKPNIIFILADDIGFQSLGCYGGVETKGYGAVRTPNLDAMAKSGMRFEHCFACAVCSPARAELLTGQYNFRSGFTSIAGVRGAATMLDANVHPTLAMKLKAAGYVTAIAGKWHLGPPENKDEIPTTSTVGTKYPHIEECGFERQCIFGGGHLESYGEPKVGAYTPEIFQQWALRFIESRKDKPEPFFLYYASPLPHGPLKPTPLNPSGPGAGKRGDPANFPYVMEYLDQQVGEVVQKLTALGMRENTLVIFAADNGGDALTTVMRDGREITGHKGSLDDTGSWVPMVADWPGVISAGSVNHGMVDFTDIMPTCLDLAGAPRLDGLDGVSFAPQLQGKPGQPRQWVHVFQINRFFVRDANWKLRENGQLYDVSNSPPVEKLILPRNEAPESKAARIRLQAVLDELHPEKIGAPKAKAKPEPVKSDD